MGFHPTDRDVPKHKAAKGDTEITLLEPLRDRIGRALYEEPCNEPRNWYALSEERREPWRRDADRVIALLAQEGEDILPDSLRRPL